MLSQIEGTHQILHSYFSLNFKDSLCKKLSTTLFNSKLNMHFQGCGMGPWLVVVSPCFRENVIATCKLGCFMCSLDNLLQENVIFLFLEIKFQNGAHLKKGLF